MPNRRSSRRAGPSHSPGSASSSAGAAHPRSRPTRRGRQRAEPAEGSFEIDGGVADLIPDDERQRGWTVAINGVPSSHVDLDDPTRLDFEYMQWTGRILDVFAADGAPIDAVHVGGAGCTLPLYIAATRPGSRQLVFEVDAGMVALARSAFGLRGVAGLRLKTGDGRAGLSGLADDDADIIIRDAFSDRVRADDPSADDDTDAPKARVPAHLSTVGWCQEVARVLRGDGIYVANVADSARVRESRVEAASALEVFRHVALVAEPAQLRGRRYGNVLVVASQAELPAEALIRRLAGGAVRARYVEPPRVRELVAGVRPRHDSE
ncbi:spermidine synthase [Phytoactinopolyspora halotolerans]|uniref:Spermidine synthase-like protein n=1 Tax=Phytoactinopolyspora halotolerans TaxID=1981512 RepID=A0A6L9SD98_9ACTN|nr:fused MFS/spermidine synthase [Phytoactinopolyspora halotolerans]NEE03077.1 spermidine synthase-like protein [Phytoactinopolyspora halotolerans]